MGRLTAFGVDPDGDGVGVCVKLSYLRARYLMDQYAYSYQSCIDILL